MAPTKSQRHPLRITRGTGKLLVRALVQTAGSDRLCWRLNWLKVGNGQAEGRARSCLKVATSTVKSSSCACAGISKFKLSLRDLVEMMAERGLSMAHTTILRWVQRYAPEFEKRWSRFARPVGRSWRVRDVSEDPRRVVLPVSCRRSGGQDDQLQAQRQARCHYHDAFSLQTYSFSYVLLIRAAVRQRLYEPTCTGNRS